MTELVSIGSLWLPILVSAVAVFFASFVIWMVLPFHKKDFAKLPGEEGLMDAMRAAGVAPGMYSFPSCEGDMKRMGTPEFQEKMKQGPVGFLTVVQSGPPQMGKSLGIWFVYSLVIGVFVAYVAGRVVAPGTDYLAVFRIAGTTAFLSYSMAIVPNSIWKGATWSHTFKEILDGLVYALLTAGVFGTFWPSA